VIVGEYVVEVSVITVSVDTVSVVEMVSMEVGGSMTIVVVNVE
jgi:hypothetical protein